MPAAVKAAFAQRFPTVHDMKWEKEGSEYEAAFKQAGQELTASFDGAGTWKETETEIPVATLPAAAKQYLQAHYKGRKVSEAAKLQMADGTTRYEAEVKHSDIIFDANGGFLEEINKHSQGSTNIDVDMWKKAISLRKVVKTR